MSERCQDYSTTSGSVTVLPINRGHEVDQGGTCSVNIDCLLGRYTMLQEKVASCYAIFAALGVEDSSPSLLAQAGGKAGHYICVVPFLALGYPTCSR